MNEALWYFAGLVTPFVVLLLALAWEWVTDKNMRLDCLRCGRSFGEIGEDFARLQRLKFRWHRRNGECQRGTT